MKLDVFSALGAPVDAARPLVDLQSCAAATRLIERADLGCLLCSASVNPEPHLEVVEELVGVRLPTEPGTVAGQEQRQAIWLSPRSWLLLCTLDEEFSLSAAISESFRAYEIHVCCYSDYLCWLEISGPEAEDLLRTGGFLSLDGRSPMRGAAKRGLLAGVPLIIYREKGGDWLLGVERSNARYFVDWLKASLCQKEALREQS